MAANAALGSIMKIVSEMEGLRFENPEYFFLLALLPAALGLFVVSRWLRRRALRRFGRQEILAGMMPWVSGKRAWFKFMMISAGWAFVAIAATNPQTGSRLGEAKRQGVDIMVVLDVSRSMLAEDVRPNRMERARRAVSRLIDNLEQDRVGLVIFAGSAITQVPLTADLTAAGMMLSTVHTGSIQQQGTAIASAIERAKASFAEDGRSRAMIIISDGENHLDDPVAAARLARQQGITIHTVGIGTPEGAPIPVYRNNQLSGFLRDNQGNTVITRYDEATLRQIAETGGGRFSAGTGPDLGLATLLDEIRGMEKETYETMVFADFESRFRMFTALALVLLVIDIFIFERKNKWFQKLRLFSDW
jgi:Ca-activated chloride channel homolog